MKKLLLLSLGIAVATGGFAQTKRTFNHTPELVNVISNAPNTIAAKTTAIGDTEVLSNITSNDTLTLYSVGSTDDSGYVTGTDAYGDMGFAERYDINGNDSSIQVFGVLAFFGGTVNPASTKTVSFKIWDQGSQVEAPFGDPNIIESGLPNNVLDSLTTSVTQLGIPDSGTEQIFAVPTALLSASFFVGYEINYNYAALNGDTLGLICSLDGERTSPLYSVSGTDTIINNQNVTEYNDGSGWHDDATDNFGIYNDLEIFPIVVINNPTGVTSITKNNLTFYGNYPNPAINSTNIKFSLNATADVTIQITDINGRVINTIKQSNLGAGEHIIPVQTESLAAGNYLYIIHTSNGDGIASKFTVAN